MSTAVLVVAALVFSATGALPYSNGSVTTFGFWKLGAVGQTGFFDRIDGLSCPAKGGCVVLAGDFPQPASPEVRWSIGSISGRTIAALPSRMSVEPGDMSCATQLVCLAMGRDGAVRTTDGGKTFQLLRPTLNDVSFRCDAPDRCYAFSTSSFALSTDEGAHWKMLRTFPVPPPSSRPLRVPKILSGACPTLSDCFVLGQYGLNAYAAYTSNGGRSWASSTGVAGSLELSDARCVSDVTCYGLASAQPGPIASIRTSDEGRRWTMMPAIPGTNIFLGYGCIGLRTCIIALDNADGDNSFVDVTSDGGTTWSRTFVLPSSANFGPFSCGGGRCAFGVWYSGEGTQPSVELTTDDGESWADIPFPRIASVTRS
jgi:hypothetical protein